jgi:hypothetical protein
MKEQENDHNAALTEVVTESALVPASSLLDAVEAAKENALKTFRWGSYEQIQVDIDALVDAVRAESGLLWATYRPQHHLECGRVRRRHQCGCWWDYEGKLRVVDGCNLNAAQHFALPFANECTCGLSALLAQLETP